MGDIVRLGTFDPTACYRVMARTVEAQTHPQFVTSNPRAIAPVTSPDRHRSNRKRSTAMPTFEPTVPAFFTVPIIDATVIASLFLAYMILAFSFGAPHRPPLWRAALARWRQRTRRGPVMPCGHTHTRHLDITHTRLAACDECQLVVRLDPAPTVTHQSTPHDLTPAA